MRSLEQDNREDKSRNVEKKPHQSSYFSKIIENRGATPPFIKKKELSKNNLQNDTNITNKTNNYSSNGNFISFL